MDTPFIFLCKLAWDARFRIPIIISIAFMAFDIRMQIEINVQMRSIHRRHFHHHAIDDDADYEEEDDDDDNDSWSTEDDSDEDVYEEVNR